MFTEITVQFRAVITSISDVRSYTFKSGATKVTATIWCVPDKAQLGVSSFPVEATEEQIKLDGATLRNMISKPTTMTCKATFFKGAARFSLISITR
jgi:hypothetical protein